MILLFIGIRLCRLSVFTLSNDTVFIRLVFKNSISHDWFFDHSVTSSSSLALFTHLCGEEEVLSGALTALMERKHSWSQDWKRGSLWIATLLLARNSIVSLFWGCLFFFLFVCLFFRYVIKHLRSQCYPDLWCCGHMDVFPVFCVWLAENELLNWSRWYSE